MKIFLLRHAIAVPRGTVAYPNDDRPLTEEGIKKMTKAAQGAAALLPAIDLVLTSPLQRAHETAKILAKAIGAEYRIEVCKLLAPGSSMKSLLTYLSKYKNLQTMLLVGHEPDLGYLASTLLGCQTSAVQFKKGSLCCIELTSLQPLKPGTLLFHLPPRLLRSLD